MTDGWKKNTDGEEFVADVQRLFSSLHISAADPAFAALLELAATPAVVKRRQRQGVTLIHIDARYLTALLIYQDHVWGVFVHQTAHPVEELLDDLKEFRLGWLPDEVVRRQGGLGTAFCGELPAGAEGFVPTFITGERQNIMAGQGILVSQSCVAE